MRLGYVSHDDLIYSKCQAGSSSVYAPGTKEIPPPTPYQKCETQSIEGFYTDSRVSPSTLTLLVQESFRRIVDYNNKK
jgi:hypothetical protein